MAETAKILSHSKTVLLPSDKAGCSLAESITAEDVRQLKARFPGLPVVAYVNTYADVKAEVDICCTSGNAVKIVRSYEGQKVILVHDQHLGSVVAEILGRDLILWPGYCHVHAAITEEDVRGAKARAPRAVVMVHPECTEPVRLLADQILSTGGMLRFARQSRAGTIIVGTETGILHALKKENRDIRYVPASERAVCPNMKKISPEKILWALEDLRGRVTVPAEISAGARRSLERMTEVAPGDSKGRSHV